MNKKDRGLFIGEEYLTDKQTEEKEFFEYNNKNIIYAKTDKITKNEGGFTRWVKYKVDGDDYVSFNIFVTDGEKYIRKNYPEISVLEWGCAKENTPSIKLANKMGFDFYDYFDNGDLWVGRKEIK